MESDEGSRQTSARNTYASIAAITEKNGRGDSRDFLDAPKESNRREQICLNDEDN